MAGRRSRSTGFAGSVLGLLSFGSIAQAIAARASGFGLRVIAHDPYHPADRIAAQGATPVSFDDLIEQSDYLVVQAPLTKETHHLIGEDEFLRMKPTAFLINTARGPIVSDEALYRALAEGWIAGAGLDDLEEEPAKRHETGSPSTRCSRCPTRSSPRTRRTTLRRRSRTVRDFAAREVVRVLTGQQPVSPVNAVEGFTLRQG